MQRPAAASQVAGLPARKQISPQHGVQMQGATRLKLESERPLSHSGNADAVQTGSVLQNVVLEHHLKSVIQMQCHVLLLITERSLMKDAVVQQVPPFCWSNCKKHRWQRRI